MNISLPAISLVFAAAMFMPTQVACSDTLVHGVGSEIQDSLNAEAVLEKPSVGENTLLIKVSDAAGQPIKDARIILSAAMAGMDMGTMHPEVKSKGDGTYSAVVSFSMTGTWRITAKIEASGLSIVKQFDFQVKSGGEIGSGKPSKEMGMASMQGRFGPWTMQREASGTSWIPDSSPMYMKTLPKSGRYSLAAMGFMTLNFSDAGGPRGNSRFYSNSMLMLMGRRETGSGTLGFSVMASLDPVFNGEFGYPNLFQTGETAYGQPLTDYQHPHDLLAEAAVSYSHPVSKGMRAFLYAAPVGEPALGGPTFMHRPSGAEIPEAPIGHHWFDSTHIAWGVLTGGISGERWQAEASVFNGHEPDEIRYSPDPIALNSASVRMTVNPNRNLSVNASYGFLHSPETTAPGEHEHRFTAAAVWNQPLGLDNLSAAFAFGQNILKNGEKSNAFLAETTYQRGPLSLFARWETVDKDELVGVPPGRYRVSKFVFGGVRDVVRQDGLDFGLGAYAGLYSFPQSLQPFYGRNPVTVGVFLRIRPSRMRHEMAMGTH